jgi:YD repeat-containing protein
MRPRSVLFLLLLTAPLVFPAGSFSEEVQYYRSNGQGMLLARVPAALKDQSQWVLKVTRDGGDEDRRLYNNGKEVRRWQVSWNSSRTERVEREYAGVKLAARRVYDETGSILREEEFQDGKLSRTTRYGYDGGRLARRRETGADGKDLASETYVYADNGRLREVRRRTPDGAVDVSAWVAGRSGLAEQRSLVDGTLLVERYDPDGRPVDREKLVNGTEVSVEAFAYDLDSAKLVSSTERRPADAMVTDRSYDPQGRLAAETVRVRDAVKESSTWERDAKGKVIARTRRGADGLEVWKYTYTDAADPLREEYWQRGVLVKVIAYGEDKHRTEELYRRGELFLKVAYDGDKRLREEVYSGGDLVRARDFP